MTPRYRVCGLGADGLLVDTRATAAGSIIWRGPYAVAVELAELADNLAAAHVTPAVMHLAMRANAEVRDVDAFTADILGRELGRALVQARPWTVLTL